METHTLTEDQARDLGRALEKHISQEMPVGDAGQTLLVALQRISPNQNQKYATLYTNSEEEEIFQALIHSHWPKREGPTNQQ